MGENEKKEEAKPLSEKTTFYHIKKGLSFFGILYSRKTRHPVHLTKVFFLWVLGIFGLFLLGGVGVYEYSTYPGFCNSCHIMEPYYNAWKTSKHFGHASCVDCHYPPPKTFLEHFWHKFQASAQVVKYITRTYSSKPFADIQDASCLRSGCHSNRLLEGRIITARGVKFDHRPHLTETRRGRQLRCVSCHSQIVVGKHIEVTYDTCFLCHFRETGEGQERKPSVNCLGCHELPTKNFKVGNMTYNHKDFVTERGIACRSCHLEVTSGEGKAHQDRCFTCHNQPDKLARFGDIPFIHENHVTKHHVACLHCHEEMPHGRLTTQPTTESQPTAETRPMVSAEYPAKLTFDCKFCHESKHVGQLEMYSGEVASLGLPKIPSPMYLANVDCVGCHYQEGRQAMEVPFTGTTIVASEDACVKCHGPMFKGILEETRQELKAGLVELDKKLTAVLAALETSKLPEQEKTEAKNKIARAQLLREFVHASHGVHNIYLASLTMREEDKILTELGQKLNATLPDLSTQPLFSGGYCATMCHGKVGVKVPPETVNVGGKVMPHMMHTTMMGCVACHQIGGHKSVPLKSDVKKDVCSSCHPE